MKNSLVHHNITARQAEIIMAAAHLFHEKGYLATSIRDISEALDMTSAALYYHFKNKEEILLEIMNIGLHRLHTAVQDAIAAEDDLWAKVRAALRTHLRISLENQDFAFVLLKDLRHLSPEWRAKIIARRDAYEDLWEGILITGRESGTFNSSVDLNLLRLLTFGATNLVVSWYRPSGTYQPEEIADAFLEYIGYGVLNGQPTAVSADAFLSTLDGSPANDA